MSFFSLDWKFEFKLFLIGGFQPLYRVSARSSGLIPYDQEDYDKMLGEFSRPFQPPALLNDQSEVKQAQSYIHQYNSRDIYNVSLESDSSSVWTISPPAERDIINYLNSDSTIIMFFKWTFSLYALIAAVFL